MIHIRMNGENYYPKIMQFPGGEINVTLPSNLPGFSTYTIRVKIKTPSDIMALLLTKDAMDIKYDSYVIGTLRIPYVPYARQDRACNFGEALSIRVMARLINSMNFSKVLTCDNHSDVTTALIDNCVNTSVEYVLSKSVVINELIKSADLLLCSPDAGANKKTLEVAKVFGGLPIVRADKIRDTKTGNITKTEVYCDDLLGQDVLIVDDICDGGMTFIKLAEALKEKGAGDLYLYVTHGIFSKGLEPLSMYKKIYTTDSLMSAEDRTDLLEIIKL